MLVKSRGRGLVVNILETEHNIHALSIIYHILRDAQSHIKTRHLRTAKVTQLKSHEMQQAAVCYVKRN